MGRDTYFFTNENPAKRYEILIYTTTGKRIRESIVAVSRDDAWRKAFRQYWQAVTVQVL